jgi:hypothetical protein
VNSRLNSDRTAAALEAFMNGFTGGEEYYRVGVSRLCFITEGVKAVAEREAAFWFCDVVASHASSILSRDSFSQITLEVRDDGHTTFTATDGNEPPTVYAAQTIPRTGFTPGTWTFYLERATGLEGAWYGVLLLPSEH